MNGYDFGRVSATAFYPIFARGEYSDIPFAKEMLAHLVASEKRPEELDQARPEDWRNFASFFEGRFKSVSRILTELGATQILELASGFSPRGLDWCRRGVLYVEADLPGMIEMKRELVKALMGSVPPNLKLCEASVVNRDEVMAACQFFQPKPVFVTCEGLLRYLTFDEKTRLAANVKEILDRFGGAWITPDIHLKKWAPERQRSERRLLARLGRDISPNYFESSEHARRFFESCGFTVEARPLLEGVRDSVASLSMASPELREQLEQRETFILRAAPPA